MLATRSPEEFQAVMEELAVDMVFTTALSDGAVVEVEPEGATRPLTFECRVEYAQKVRHYLPALQAKGVARALMVVNGTPPQL